MKKIRDLRPCHAYKLRCRRPGEPVQWTKSRGGGQHRKSLGGKTCHDLPLPIFFLSYENPGAFDKLDFWW